MAALRSVVMVMVFASGCALYGGPDDNEPDVEMPGDELPGDEMPGDGPPIPLVPDANGCHAVASLDGSASTSTSFGPYVFGTGTFCLHLDASQLHRGHFMASTRYQPGSTSGFTIEITEATGSPIATGWDVSVGHTDTRTFANLEMAVTGGTQRDVRLVVSSNDKTSSVSVALFDPLE